MRIINILCLLVAALLAGACKEGETAVDRATREGILIMGNTSEPKGLDPHIVSGVLESNIISALFEGLVVAHPSKDGVALAAFLAVCGVMRTLSGGGSVV